ncbi:C-3 sterol dehydrogenase [Lentinula edodes]|uniref:C-3 sterol dehydrogenase n=1 Tax=Lentinula edodes TaxID=5353 RepID=A0A1Q3EMA6_LENED|nr:C-3 sterol dehydrogenase [Lentinula edodes]
MGQKTPTFLLLPITPLAQSSDTSLIPLAPPTASTPIHHSVSLNKMKKKVIIEKQETDLGQFVDARPLLLNGLLGRHIAKQLQDRGDNVSVLDIVQRYDDIPFYHGDISDEAAVLSVLKQCGATCIIHCASPHAKSAAPEQFWKVNVDGTKALIAASTRLGINKFVYTSSSGVVFDGSDLENIDESHPYARKPLDVYMETKVQAEKIVLAANGKDGLSTVILRPSGIFGKVS